MDNYAIAEQFSLLARLMDIHGDNPFKSKSYASAAFALEKLDVEVATLEPAAIPGLRGIGSSVAGKVQELIATGKLSTLDKLIAQTPPGVLEMLNIKGLGPKKIHTLWKELHIDTLNALQDACRNGRIAATKGFGDKTQEKILDAIHFHKQNAGKFLYAQVEAFAHALTARLSQRFPDNRHALTGAFRRQCEVINELEWVSTIDVKDAKRFFEVEAFSLVSESNEWVEFQSGEGLLLRLHFCATDDFGGTLFRTTGNDVFTFTWQSAGLPSKAAEEETLFESAGLPFIPPYLRETETVLARARAGALPEALQVEDIRGIIHAHSTWSDGAHTLEEMALELKARGFEYLVISDHSKAAYYANGLDEARIRAQHAEIDVLNEKLAPFKIYKSIECDILADGSLDYSNAVLATFDLVIASIHSNLDMPAEKAMMRLMGAINNPYVTIMGHLTGRLLARRKGYPVDHVAIIDACAERGVAIEINASPVRLDMDWRYVEYALEKGLLLSVNPDAHSFEDIGNLKYGVKVAQKGGLTKERNISSFTREEFEAFLNRRKIK
ncbi:helix-hairpin-helix domain-containing protein [Flaviaesturariibacter aridisoli]|uniref:DNA-directed DNA polymerase n=1 Tax=Flaviaesturariibacter aridisoli TaxID=2545761 RepID=A0A4R4DWH0_9BACT|nr:helix-hairpin-helix domain-containing protein [Flaviaesturariibacter aridisoli]TCZ68332.1 DNA polymerase/3'-5' exonuclease PolX [Flaviaesturariibacter aridisoli]